MSDYLCGHNSKPVFLTNNVFSLQSCMAEWSVWRITTGFEGDKSECFRCYHKRKKQEEKK